MADKISILGITAPQRAYLFPTVVGPQQNPNGRIRFEQNNALFFQYWPQSLQDDYQVGYVEHEIPGGSHPLYQWVSGKGRQITFQALFTAEINQTRRDNILTGVFGAANPEGIPSGPFTVDIAAALARIRSWMMPEYKKGGRLGETNPPQILTLAFPGTNLGGNTDLINVILRSAPVTYESWFPNGEPRIASVQLTFNEIIQSQTGGEKATRVHFKSRSELTAKAEGYKLRGLADRPFAGGS